MIPTAYQLSKHYSEIHAPTAVVFGERDQIVSPNQAKRLCEVMPHASLFKAKGAGHMLHHTNASDVLSALKAVEEGTQGVG